MLIVVKLITAGCIFATFDRFWKPWNPSEDALKLAAEMLNDEKFPTAPREIGKRHGWGSRVI